MGSEVEPPTPTPVWIPLLSLLACRTLGMLVNTPEPQSFPVQNGVIGRLEEIKTFRTVPGKKKKTSTHKIALSLLVMGKLLIGCVAFSI